MCSQPSVASKSSDNNENGVNSSEDSNEDNKGKPIKDDQYVTVITVSSYGEIQRPSKVSNPKQPLIDNPLYQSSQPLGPKVDKSSDNSTNKLSEIKDTTNQNNSSIEVNVQNQGLCQKF